MKKLKLFIQDLKYGVEQVKAHRRERRITEAKLRAASIVITEISKVFDAAISRRAKYLPKDKVLGECQAPDYILGSVDGINIFEELTEKEALQRSLKKAEQDEDYIKAAALRDQLKKLEQ